jgi:hypothetical protein
VPHKAGQPPDLVKNDAVEDGPVTAVTEIAGFALQAAKREKSTVSSESMGEASGCAAESVDATSIVTREADEFVAKPSAEERRVADILSHPHEETCEVSKQEIEVSTSTANGHFIPSSSADDVHKCYCGNLLEEDSLFCRKCGCRRETVQSCGCGNVFEPDSLFCRKCGSRRPERPTSQKEIWVSAWSKESSKSAIGASHRSPSVSSKDSLEDQWGEMLEQQSSFSWRALAGQIEHIFQPIGGDLWCSGHARQQQSLRAPEFGNLQPGSASMTADPANIRLQPASSEPLPKHSEA